MQSRSGVYPCRHRRCLGVNQDKQRMGIEANSQNVSMGIDKHHDTLQVQAILLTAAVLKSPKYKRHTPMRTRSSIGNSAR